MIWTPKKKFSYIFVNGLMANFQFRGPNQKFLLTKVVLAKNFQISRNYAGRAGSRTHATRLVLAAKQQRTSAKTQASDWNQRFFFLLALKAWIFWKSNGAKEEVKLFAKSGWILDKDKALESILDGSPNARETLVQVSTCGNLCQRETKNQILLKFRLQKC